MPGRSSDAVDLGDGAVAPRGWAGSRDRRSESGACATYSESQSLYARTIARWYSASWLATIAWPRAAASGRAPRRRRRRGPSPRGAPPGRSRRRGCPRSAPSRVISSGASPAHAFMPKLIGSRDALDAPTRRPASKRSMRGARSRNRAETRSPRGRAARSRGCRPRSAGTSGGCARARAPTLRLCVGSCTRPGPARRRTLGPSAAGSTTARNYGADSLCGGSRPAQPVAQRARPAAGIGAARRVRA